MAVVAWKVTAKLFTDPVCVGEAEKAVKVLVGSGRVSAPALDSDISDNKRVVAVQPRKETLKEKKAAMLGLALISTR